MLAGQENAIEIDRVLTPPVRQRHVNHWHCQPDAGVRYQGIKAAEFLFRSGDDLDPARLVGNVVPMKPGFAARGLNGCGGLVSSRFVDVRQNHARAFRGERLCAGRADPNCCAGDQGDLTLECCLYHCAFPYGLAPTWGRRS